MDRFTAEHLDTWLERTVLDCDQHAAKQQILALLRDHPDLVNTHTWPEMRSLGERNYLDS